MAFNNSNQDQSRAFYAFNLSNITDEIIGAQLDLTFPFSSGNPSLELRDVTSNVNDLVNNNGDARTFYRDLGNGQRYASGTGVTSFTLNANALTDLNDSAGGLFALGLRNRTSGSWVWSFGARLTLTTATPEASEIILIVAGIGLLFFVARRKNIITAQFKGHWVIIHFDARFIHYQPKNFVDIL